MAAIPPLSRYRLQISHSPVKPDVLRFRGTETLSQPFSWRIEFTTPLASIPPEQILMKYARFIMGDSKAVHGVITRLEQLSVNSDQAHYAVTLESRLALLAYSRRCAIYQNMSVPEVVEQILRTHQLEGADFEFRLSRHYPKREIITQWQETDLEFIQRLLAETGIWFRQEMNPLTENDVTIFGDSQLHYLFQGLLPYHPPSGLYDGAELCCWGVRTWHRAVTGKVTTRDYNYRTAAEPMDATLAVRSAAITTGEHYRYAEPYPDAGDDTDPEPDTESGAFYARLHHERLLNQSTRVHLFSNADWLSPGMVIEPEGANLHNLKDGVVITFTSYLGSRDSRLQISVWGMPYSEQFCFRPPEIPRPEILGTLPGRVESRSPDDPYAYLDEHGRYRVRMYFDLDHCEPGYAYPWLRLMKPDAGEKHGWHMPLTDGTEVGVAFHKGDPDRPYLAFAFHDSAHRDIVNHDNRSQNILKTAASNTLRMEDQRGEEHIHLSSEYGCSQLGQGHLVDAQGKPRGNGFELRTDEYGVIRVAKGGFICADGQFKATGEVLDMETALQEIRHCLLQVQQLQLAAEQAQALKADVDSQIHMLNERLQPLNQALLFSAPEGVTLTSGEHLQLAASRNVAVYASGDTHLGAMGNMSALAGKQLSLFARTGQLSLKASEGPIDIQAQQGNLRLFSEKKLSFSSANDISITGKKRITLIGGGSYLKLEQGKIEYGTQADYLRRAQRSAVLAPATMPMKIPRTGTTYIYSAIYQLQDEQGNLLVDIPYRLTTASGQITTGYSDEQGYTLPIYTTRLEEVELHIVQQSPSPEETLWFIGDNDSLPLETELREPS